MNEPEKVGINLALGYSKKEVARIMKKSVNTVSNEADMLYKQTGCHNLADLTRKLIKRYTGIPVEDVLINAMKDALVLVAVVFFIWAMLQPEIMEELSTSFNAILNNK